MQLSTITSILVFTAAASCALSEKLRKRDVCTMTGYAYTGCVIGGGGPGQSPVCSYSYGVDLEYVGGVPITGIPGANSVKINGETYGPDKTKLPSDITWVPHGSGVAFDSCDVIYEGVTYSGKGYGLDAPAGYIDSECRADFPCPGGLA